MRPNFDDTCGIVSDQLAMAPSSWRLLYAYTGNERIKENMCFIAGYYLAWLISFKRKTVRHSFSLQHINLFRNFDGNMMIGKDFTQPDKAGSFSFELVYL